MMLVRLPPPTRFLKATLVDPIYPGETSESVPLEVDRSLTLVVSVRPSVRCREQPGIMPRMFSALAARISFGDEPDDFYTTSGRGNEFVCFADFSGEQNGVHPLLRVMQPTSCINVAFRHLGDSFDLIPELSFGFLRWSDLESCARAKS